MELDSVFTGTVGLFTGMSGSHRVLVGDYAGGMLMALLFLGTAASLVYWPSSNDIRSKASSFQVTNFLMLILGLWYIYDMFILFLKMSAPENINDVFGKSVIWKNNNKSRYVGSAILIFTIVALFLVV